MFTVSTFPYFPRPPIASLSYWDPINPLTFLGPSGLRGGRGKREGAVYGVDVTMENPDHRRVRSSVGSNASPS